MSKLDPRIETVRVKYGLQTDDFWELPQKKGTWIAKHAALEVAAAKAGIAFDMPVVLEADGGAKCAALCVAGALDGRKEWSIGEASPANSKNAYPFAMAEKRAKDRVILKLIGLHGLTYSEDEADDFKDKAPASDAPKHEDKKPANTDSESAKAKAWGEDAIRFVNRTGDSTKFKSWHDANLQTIARLGELHPDIHTRLLVAISGREDAFAAARAA
jgi:hypothetical protein